MEAAIQQQQQQPAPGSSSSSTTSSSEKREVASEGEGEEETEAIGEPPARPAAVAAQQDKPTIATTRDTRRSATSNKDTGGPQHHTTSTPHQGPQHGSAAGGAAGSPALTSMAYQQKHALHRLKRLKKRAPHRDLVISFVPRLRTSIINRLDFFHRYSKQEQEVLSCFDFLDELLVNFCDGGPGESSPRYSHKLYQSMIYQLI